MSNPMATPLPWDLVSSAYAAEIVPSFEAYARDALRFAAVPAGQPIVDVACGPGTLAFLAAERGHPVSALDFWGGRMWSAVGHTACMAHRRYGALITSGQSSRIIRFAASRTANVYAEVVAATLSSCFGIRRSTRMI